MTAAKVRQIAKTTKKSKAASIKDNFFFRIKQFKNDYKKKILRIKP